MELLNIVSSAFYIMAIVTFGNCEPACSKFDYEERLLGKMIKFEFDNKLMKSDVTNTIQEMKNEFDEMRRKLNDMANDVLSLEQRQKETAGATEQMKTVISNVENNQRLAFESLATNLTEQVRTGIKSTPLVLFQVHGPKYLTLEAGQKILSNTIVINEGAGYDSDTGMFTAPVSGLYMFTLQVCVPLDRNMYYAIVHDDTIIVQGRVYKNKTYQCPTATAAHFLREGTHVWPKCTFKNGNALNELSESQSHHWTWFSGVLIH